MSTKAIRAALETALAAMTPAIDIEYENVAYIVKDGVPYQRVTLLPAVTEDLTHDRLKREQGIFQVLLCYPVGIGTAQIGMRAEAIKNTFRYGAEFAADGVTVKMDGSPYIAPGLYDGDRWCVPVRIRYYANIPTQTD